MNKKLIATLVALGMVLGAFAMMATPVKAADPMTWHFVDVVTFADLRVRDTVADGTNPNGGVARWLVESVPAEVNTDVTAVNGAPYATMSNWIGADGGTGLDYYVTVQTNAAQTNPSAGEPVVFFLEKDTNIAASPQVYNPTSGAFTGGTVPNGYIWAGADVMAFGDIEPLPGASPPDTFFEVMKMPVPDLSGAPSITWAGVTQEADTCGDTNAEIVSWELYESAADTGPWAQVGTAAFGAPINYAAALPNWYSVGITWTGGVLCLVLSEPIQPVISGTFAPESSALLAAPAVHDGNTITESVTITATIDESADDSSPDILNGAQYRVDGGITYAMTPVDTIWNGITEDVTATFDFPNGFTEGVHTFEVAGSDDGDGMNATWTAGGTFTVTDTTDPVAAWTSEPVAGFIDSTLSFVAEYEDFSDLDAGIGVTYLSYQVNGGPVQYEAFTPGAQTWGSYVYAAMTASIDTTGMSVGDSITWNGLVTDTAATPGATILGAGGPIVLADAPTLINPFALFGTVYLYDGTSVGGYVGIPAPAGVPVSVTYNHFTLGIITVNAIGGTDADGEFTIDIMESMLGDPYELEIEAGPFTGYGNMGYDNLPCLDYSLTGGVENDVICGIPHHVDITLPAPLFNTNAGANMATTYQVMDIDGIPAQGYFSFEGDMDWTSTDVAFTNVDGPITFDGVADAGTHTGDLIMMTAGVQTIRIADEDGGVAPPPWMPTPGTNDFLTPWGDFGPVLIGGVSTPVYLDDWDEIDVNVLADQFFWHLVAGGWNTVSAPTDPVIGTASPNTLFDADDAMNDIFAITGDIGLQMAEKNGPASYNVVLLGCGEGAAFLIDSTHGYWIYADIAVDHGFYGIDYDIIADPTLNVVTTIAGWNLLGFTHNYNAGAWGNIPTASNFCNGVGPLNVGPGIGAASMIIATQWDYTAQWYYSYVMTPTFDMPTRDWAWDFSYAGSPGNGFYLWTEAPIVITFDVAY